MGELRGAGTTTTNTTAETGPKGNMIGRWTKEEHHQFVTGLETFGKDWKRISESIPTRTVVQIRTHAQKYFQKLEKQNQKDGIPSIINSSVASPSSSRGTPRTRKNAKVSARAAAAAAAAAVAATSSPRRSGGAASTPAAATSSKSTPAPSSAPTTSAPSKLTIKPPSAASLPPPSPLPSSSKRGSGRRGRAGGARKGRAARGNKRAVAAPPTPVSFSRQADAPRSPTCLSPVLFGLPPPAPAAIVAGGGARGTSLADADPASPGPRMLQPHLHPPAPNPATIMSPVVPTSSLLRDADEDEEHDDVGVAGRASRRVFAVASLFESPTGVKDDLGFGFGPPLLAPFPGPTKRRRTSDASSLPSDCGDLASKDPSCPKQRGDLFQCASPIAPMPGSVGRARVDSLHSLDHFGPVLDLGDENDTDGSASSGGDDAMAGGGAGPATLSGDGNSAGDDGCDLDSFLAKLPIEPSVLDVTDADLAATYGLVFNPDEFLQL